MNGGSARSRLAPARRGQLGADDLEEVLEEKRQSIARSEVLEFCVTETGTEAIGGLRRSRTGYSVIVPFPTKPVASDCPCRGACCW